MKYDVAIIGAGPGGIFSAYELVKKNEDLNIAVYEAGNPLEKRRCPIDGVKVKSCIGCKTCAIMSGFGGAGAFSDGKYNITNAFGGTRCPIDGVKVKSCIGCKTCAIMSGFGGAGAFSDGKYNITNAFGGTLYEHIGRQQSIELMKYVDDINMSHGGEGTKMYSTAGTKFKKLCMQNQLNLHIGRQQSIELMKYVDDINMSHGGEGTKMYSTAGTKFKKLCMQNQLNLLDASVRHLGTDINYVVLENIYEELKNKVDFHFNCTVERLEVIEDGYRIFYGDESADCDRCVISVGRSGSKWMQTVCKDLEISTLSNRVDLGVRVEIPAEIFSHLTDELYESKIVYRTEKFEDNVRTFCMNPYGIVVNENTNGIVTVNGHSYEDAEKQTENTNFALLVSKHFSEPFKDSNGYGESIARLSDAEKQTENTNFALLVSKHFSEPFKDSNGYGESIARLSNMLGGGVIVQRFGDLIRGRRSNEKRIEEGLVRPTLAATPGDLSLVLPKRIMDGIIEMRFGDLIRGRRSNEKRIEEGLVRPTLAATPGDLSLVLPKRIMDGIIEMIYALDKIAPGTANDDTLLYGVEVKFYNMEVDIDENLETRYKGLYVIGDGSGVTHSLSHASASGVYVARHIIETIEK